MLKTRRYRLVPANSVSRSACRAAACRFANALRFSSAHRQAWPEAVIPKTCPWSPKMNAAQSEDLFANPPCDASDEVRLLDAECRRLNGIVAIGVRNRCLRLTIMTGCHAHACRGHADHPRLGSVGDRPRPCPRKRGHGTRDLSELSTKAPGSCDKAPTRRDMERQNEPKSWRSSPEMPKRRANPSDTNRNKANPCIRFPTNRRGIVGLGSGIGGRGGSMNRRRRPEGGAGSSSVLSERRQVGR